MLYREVRRNRRRRAIMTYSRNIYDRTVALHTWQPSIATTSLCTGKEPGLKFNIWNYFELILNNGLKYVKWERVRMKQRQNYTATKWHGRQNDTVVKMTRCVTLAWRVTLARRQNGTVCQFSTATKWTLLLMVVR